MTGKYLLDNLKEYGRYRDEMYDADGKPCGVWKWWYDEGKTNRKAILFFDGNDPEEMVAFYEDGTKRMHGEYRKC